MTSLLSEYCRRRGMECILPTSDGVCFFNEHKRPALACLTSNYPKSVDTCHRCGTPGTLVTVELFGPKEGGFTLLHHNHVHPDTNLIRHVESQGLRGSPVYLGNNGEVERWVWQFFLFHHRLRYSRPWKAWVEKQDQDEPLRTNEQMAHCAIKYPIIYNTYYATYQTFTVGRKYLLFG